MKRILQETSFESRDDYFAASNDERSTVDANRGSALPMASENTVQITQLPLEVPLFVIATVGSGEQVDATWVRKGRGCMRYIGPRLTQAHQNALFVFVNELRGQPVYTEVEFSPSEVLRRMGWSEGTRTINRLRELLDDLANGQVRMWAEGANEKRTASRDRLVAWFKPSDAERWKIRLGPCALELCAEYLPTGKTKKTPLTTINLAVRRELGDGLSSWLYGWIRADSCLLPFEYCELHEASGSANGSMKSFGEEVRGALKVLQERRLISGFTPTRGKVKIWK